MSNMLKQPSILIGLRYTYSKRHNHFISFISLISMLGLTLGVLALIVVLSVINGSESIMRELTLITVPHIELSKSEGGISDWRARSQQVLQSPNVLAAAPFIRGEAMLSHGGNFQLAEIRAVLPQHENKVSKLAQTMLEGALEDLLPGEKGIIVGRSLARLLRVEMGEAITLILADYTHNQTTTNPIIKPKLRRFTVVGIFELGFTADSTLALVHLRAGEELFSQGIHLRIAVDDATDAHVIAGNIIKTLPATIQISDWTQTQSSLFSALRLEKLMTGFMLMMIVAIAAFNIISALVMAVTDKQADIAILRTMGASRLMIMTIFMIQGASIGLLGTLLGTAFGVSIALNLSDISQWIEVLLNAQLAPENVYMISFLPSKLLLTDVVVVVFAALSISFLATLYPAYRAAQIHPAEVLRYE